MNCKLLEHNHLPNISSASGVEYWNEKLYIMGDDVAHLYECDEKGGLLRKIILFASKYSHRIPKSEKPDLEGMTMLEINQQWYFALLGSGSKQGLRDNLYCVSTSSTNEVITYPLSKLYDKLRTLPQIKELNIEGFAVVENQHILFQRGGTFQDNYLIVCNLYSTDFRLSQIETPLIDGIKTGISGATYHAETDTMWICASAEDTANAIDDGEIKGSLIAVILNFSQKLASNCLMIDDYVIPDFWGQQKIESITIKKIENNQSVMLAAVADNDNGTSELFMIKVEINDF